MIEVLDWFAQDRIRVAGFLVVFITICYGLSMIAEAARGKDK